MELAGSGVASTCSPAVQGAEKAKSQGPVGLVLPCPPPHCPDWFTAGWPVIRTSLTGVKKQNSTE